MSSRSSTAFLLIVVLAAGRAAHGQNIAILGVSRFEARISNYWQLDCLSGKAPDFSEKDPLWSSIRTSDPRSESKSPLPVPKTHPTFQLHAHEACSVVAICVCNPGRSPLGINRRMIRLPIKAGLVTSTATATTTLTPRPTATSTPTVIPSLSPLPTATATPKTSEPPGALHPFPSMVESSNAHSQF